MNRLIKFRVWDGQTMLKNHEINGDWLLNNKFGTWKVMQFTGLVDKNGKEIYEGDIVSHFKRLYEVRKSVGGYELQAYKLWNGKFKKAFKYSLSLFTHSKTGKVDSAEIVGNVYENPEMVENFNPLKN